MKIWHYASLLCLIVTSCSSNSAATSTEKIVPVSSAQTTIIASSSAVTIDMEKHFQPLWDKLDKGSSPSNKPPVSWKPSYSVAFPSDWSPTPNTIWTRYAYAQGMDLDLRDAVRIASPWAKMELRGNAATVNIVSLNPKLDAVTIQGVSPIDAATQTVLAKEKSVTDYALQLNALPPKTDTQAAEMRAFYKTWVKYNGAFVDLVRAKHEKFFAWVYE